MDSAPAGNEGSSHSSPGGRADSISSIEGVDRVGDDCVAMVTRKCNLMNVTSAISECMYRYIGLYMLLTVPPCVVGLVFHMGLIWHCINIDSQYILVVNSCSQYTCVLCELCSYKHISQRVPCISCAAYSLSGHRQVSVRSVSGQYEVNTYPQYLDHPCVPSQVKIRTPMSSVGLWMVVSRFTCLCIQVYIL